MHPYAYALTFYSLQIGTGMGLFFLFLVISMVFIAPWHQLKHVSNVSMRPQICGIFLIYRCFRVLTNETTQQLDLLNDNEFAYAIVEELLQFPQQRGAAITCCSHCFN